MEISILHNGPIHLRKIVPGNLTDEDELEALREIHEIK
jgi:hypothetical protein